MCELFCLASRWPTRATFSLDTFAKRGAPGGSTVDGWGIALHDGRDARLYKEPEPAGNSAWLSFVGQRHPASHLIISHIRRATRGPISLANTQPFVREVGGHVHVFAHNGHLKGIEGRYDAGKKRFWPVGDTDSEIAFCLLAERLSPLWSAGAVPPLEYRVEIVTRFAAEMRELGPANFLYTDGDALFAQGHRRNQADGTFGPPGLWMLHRECALDVDGVQGFGVEVEPSGKAQVITLVASVPLTGEGWRPLAEGELVAVRHGRIVAARGSPAYA